MSVAVLSAAEKDPFKIVSVVNQVAAGRSNAVGEVTLTASAASTTVSAPNCAVGSHVFLFPRTANASAEVGNGTIYITSANVTKQQFVITHANNSQTDRAFSWLTIG